MSNDPLERMTVAELDAGSRYLKADLVTAIAEDTGEKWAALALVAWIFEKRTNPTAQLAPYREMGPNDLYRAIAGLSGIEVPAEDSAADDTATADASGGAEATPGADAVGDSASASGDPEAPGPGWLLEAEANRALPADFGADSVALPEAAAADDREAMRARIAADPMARRRG